MSALTIEETMQKQKNEAFLKLIKKYPRPAKCLKLFERGFRLEYLHQFGKTVFLTREEAEAKLKELNEK